MQGFLQAAKGYRPDFRAVLVFVAVGMFFIAKGQWLLLVAVPVAVPLLGLRNGHLLFDFLIAVPFYALLARPAFFSDGLPFAALFDRAAGFSIKERLVGAVQGNADAQWLVKLVVFNVKESYTGQYAQLKELGIVHMTVVSGFHLTLIASLIEKAFRGRARRAGQALSLATLFFYLYVLDFAVSPLRAFVMQVVGLCGAKGVARLGLAVLFMLAVEPAWMFSTAFQMSCLATYFIIALGPAIVGWNPVAKALAITAVANLAMLPVMGEIAGRVSLLGVFYNLVFGLFLPYLFVYFAIGGFIPFMASVNDGLAAGLKGFLELSSSYNLFFPVGRTLRFYCAVYYLALDWRLSQGTTPLARRTAEAAAGAGVAMFSLA